MNSIQKSTRNSSIADEFQNVSVMNEKNMCNKYLLNDTQKSIDTIKTFAPVKEVEIEEY